MKFIVLVFLISINTNASYFEKCKFKGKIVSFIDGEYTAKLTFLELGRGSHGDGCKNLKEAKFKWPKKLEIQQSYKLEYFYLNGRGPDGVINSIDWKVID